MAGSYQHLVDARGFFRGIQLLDNLGDAHEALEECYGMIQVLAEGDVARIEDARVRYREGLQGTVIDDARWDRSTNYGPSVPALPDPDRD